MAPLIDLYLSFLKIGFLSFGGFTMIPVINDVVLTKGWMIPEEVGDIVAIAEMTPGTLGINCSTFAGMRVGGIPGAICAALGILTPSFTLCLATAMFLSKFKGNPYLEAALKGIRPVCFGVILSVVISLGRTEFVVSDSVILWMPVLIAVAVGLSQHYLSISIPKTIFLAAVAGILLC